MTHLEVLARIFLTYRPTLYPWLQSLRGRTWGEYCTKETDLCIEGFESSANTFLYNAFRLLDSDLTVGHHTHVVANVRRAFRYGVPTVILYRDPSDCIPSLVSRFRPEPNEASLRYVYFYRFVLNHSGRLMLVSFDEATSDIQEVINRVDDRWAFGFPSIDPNDFERRVKNEIKEWTEKHGQSEKISLPREDRERQKEQIRDQLRKQRAFQEAKDIYAQLQDAQR
jgi:hypothetical protein